MYAMSYQYNCLAWSPFFTFKCEIIVFRVLTYYTDYKASDFSSYMFRKCDNKHVFNVYLCPFMTTLLYFQLTRHYHNHLVINQS